MASKKKPISTTVLVALITAAGIVVAAIIGALGSYANKTIEIHATETAEARLAANAGFNLTTDMVAPAATVEPAVAATATAVQAKVIFEDIFSNNNNKWDLNNKDSLISSGKYVKKVSCTSADNSLYCGQYIYIPSPALENFQIEVDAKITDAPSYVDVAIGFQLRRNGRNHYYINYFINQGFYNLDLAYDGDILNVIDKTYTSKLDQSSTSVNRVGVRAEDTTFSPIINGEIFPSGQDGNLPSDGDLYLVIFIAEGQSAMIEFDNLAIYEVK